MKRDHTVYILGAGFSVDARVPAMGRFLQSAREYYDSPTQIIPPHLQTHYDRVFDFRQKSKHCRDAIVLDLENIESLFSLIDMADTLGLTQASPVDSVKHLIAHTVSRSQNLNGPNLRIGLDNSAFASCCNYDYLKTRAQNTGSVSHLDLPLYEATMAILLGMLDPAATGSTKTFLTFNYDTVVEESLWNLNHGRADYNTTRTAYKGSRFASVPPTYTVPVLKLHGSSNWAHVQLQGTRAHMFDDYHDFSAQYPPTLVPPTWKKGEISSLTEEVWKAAYEALKSATRICIIGFSMPETDPHFKHLIAAALSENAGLYSLSVVDYNAGSELQARYKNFFQPLVDYGRYRFHNDGLIGFVRNQDFKTIGCGALVGTIS